MCSPCGDGIMSAIDFDMEIERQPNVKGDRVKIKMSGKFLPYGGRFVLFNLTLQLLDLRLTALGHNATSPTRASEVRFCLVSRRSSEQM